MSPEAVQLSGTFYCAKCLVHTTGVLLDYNQIQVF